MSKSLKQMAYDTIEAHQETIADLRTQLAKANEYTSELEVKNDSLKESLNGCTEKVLSLSGKLAKANERADKTEKEVERLRRLFHKWKQEKDNAVWESDIVFKALLSEMQVCPKGEDGLSDKEWWKRLVHQAIKKFAIGQQIEGLKDYQALCGFADCRKSIDARIAQLEEQLRKEQE